MKDNDFIIKEFQFEVRIRSCENILEEWDILDKKRKLKEEILKKQNIRKEKIKRLYG